MANNKTTIKTLMDSYLQDGASVNSIKPSDVNGTFTEMLNSLASQEDGIKGVLTTLTTASSVNIDLSVGNHFKITLDQAVQLDYSNAPSSSYGATYIIEVIQDATGNRALTFASGKFMSSGAVDIEQGGNTISELWLRWNGSKMVVNVVKNLTDI